MSKQTTYRETFEALVSRYQRRLYLYALRILHNREDAEEAVQDAFVKAHRAWTRHGAEPRHYAQLNAWFFKITLNVARNRLRRKRLVQITADRFSDSRRRSRVPGDGSSPDMILDRHTTLELVERAIDDLPSHLLEAARLRFIEGLTHCEIAERRSQPVGTVKSQVSRARRVLRQVLEPVLGVSLLPSA